MYFNRCEIKASCIRHMFSWKIKIRKKTHTHTRKNNEKECGKMKEKMPLLFAEMYLYLHFNDSAAYTLSYKIPCSLQSLFCKITWWSSTSLFALLLKMLMLYAEKSAARKQNYGKWKSVKVENIKEKKWEFNSRVKIQITILKYFLNRFWVQFLVLTVKYNKSEKGNECVHINSQHSS